MFNGSTQLIDNKLISDQATTLSSKIHYFAQGGCGSKFYKKSLFLQEHDRKNQASNGHIKHEAAKLPCIVTGSFKFTSGCPQHKSNNTLLPFQFSDFLALQIKDYGQVLFSEDSPTTEQTALCQESLLVSAQYGSL